MATTWRQDNFRFRNDDGNQAGATWIDAAGINIVKDVGAGNIPIRVRTAVSEQGTTAGALTARLYVAKNGGAYAQASATSINGVKVVDSANITDGGATTQQISAVAFVAGSVDDVNGQCVATGSIARYSGTEHEFMIQLVAANLVSGDYFDFRIYNSTIALTTYTKTGRITIRKSPPPLVMSSGGFTLTGYNVGITKHAAPVTYTLTCLPGEFILSGKNLTGLRASRLLTVTKGIYALVGRDLSGLRVSRSLAVAKGTYLLAGKDLSGLRVSRIISVSPGTYGLTRRNLPSLLVSRLLIASKGTFVLIGNDVGLTQGTPQLNNYILAVQSGQFSFTGNDLASLKASRLLGLSTGNFTLLGKTTSLRVSRLLSLLPGIFLLYGKSANLSKGGTVLYALNCETGSFLLSGYDIIFVRSSAENKGIKPPEDKIVDQAKQGKQADQKKHLSGVRG